MESAQFFVNGVDTKTTGLDVVLAWRNYFESGSKLSISLTGNFNDMKITDVKHDDLVRPLDEETFFGERDKAFLLASAPDSKIALNLDYSVNRFNIGLAFTRFSEINLLDYQVFEAPGDLGYASFDDLLVGATDTYEAKIITDLNIGIKLSDQLRLDIGSNNLLNVYPDQQDDWSDSGGYWDVVQMGFSGAFYYGRLNFNF